MPPTGQKGQPEFHDDQGPPEHGQVWEARFGSLSKDLSSGLSDLRRRHGHPEPVPEERLRDLTEFARLCFVFRPGLSDDEWEKLVCMHAGMPEPDKALMARVRREMEERFAEAAPMLSNRPAKNQEHD